LHKGSIGSTPEDTSKAEMSVNGTPTGVKFLRLIRDSAPPKGWNNRYNYKGNIDRWSEFEFVAPSTIVQFSGAVDTGTYDKGSRSGGHLVRGLHAITPETEKTSHYFFQSADGFKSPDGRSTRAASGETQPRRSIADVFREDAHMLEQQQLRLDGFDTSKLLDIPSDVARVQMVRFLSRKIQEEAARSGAPAS